MTLSRLVTVCETDPHDIGYQLTETINVSRRLNISSAQHHVIYYSEKTVLYD